jgi:hypothetical protein
VQSIRVAYAVNQVFEVFSASVTRLEKLSLPGVASSCEGAHKVAVERVWSNVFLDFFYGHWRIASVDWPVCPLSTEPLGVGALY